jgi:hypothetical protein
MAGVNGWLFANQHRAGGMVLVTVNPLPSAAPVTAARAGSFFTRLR